MTAETITQLQLIGGAVLGGLAKLGAITGAKRRRHRKDQ